MNERRFKKLARQLEAARAYARKLDEVESSIAYTIAQSLASDCSWVNSGNIDKVAETMRVTDECPHDKRLHDRPPEFVNTM